MEVIPFEYGVLSFSLKPNDMHTLTTSKDITPLMEDIGDRRVIMLGEASHGTHEYYTWRAAIQKN